MIVYYQKSTKLILIVMGHDCKKHLDDEQLEDELNSMFPDKVDDVGVSRFEEGEGAKVSAGGIWDPKNNIMTDPPPNILAPVNPNKDRLIVLEEKFENQTATLTEVQEYLFKKG